MPDVIGSPAGPLTLHVCRDGDGDGEAWVKVYEEAFPGSQRQGVDELRKLLRAGSMELDETRDQDDRIACLTITEVFGEPAPKFLLACYTATPPELRSLGIGSIHRRKLVELLKEEYPDSLGLFSEIESTKEPGLDAANLANRTRRLAFFLRLGVERLPIDYLFPSFEPNGTPLHGELLWVPFGAGPLDPSTLKAVLTRIYVDGYGVSPTAPFLDRALATAGLDG